MTRSVWGWVNAGEATVAAYWVRWTAGHAEPDASIDLCLGSWGEATTPDNRSFVSLLYRQNGSDPPAIMVIDAKPTPSRKKLATHSLRRDEVIGTPLATQVFALSDAILEQDRRLAASEQADET